MNTTIRKRLLLAAQISILLAQVAGLGIAATKVGFAQEPSALAANAFDPITDCATEYHAEIRSRAGIAVSKAHDSAMNDLDSKLLTKQSSSAPLDGNAMGERG